MSSAQEISKLLENNLFQVFGEPDSTKRLAALSEFWVADHECLFIDPMDACRTHTDISNLIGRLLEGNVGKVFRLRGRLLLVT
jgi:hypothetical protein